MPGSHDSKPCVAEKCPDCLTATQPAQVLELTDRVARQQEQAVKQQRQQEQLKAKYVKMQVRARCLRDGLGACRLSS